MYDGRYLLDITLYNIQTDLNSLILPTLLGTSIFS